MVASRTPLWACFAAGGALLGLATTLERIVHHAHVYGRTSATLLHLGIAVLIAMVTGVVVGGLLDAVDAALGRSTKRRTLAVCAAAGAIGATAYWAVVRVSKYGQMLPTPVGIVLCASSASVAMYAAARLAPRMLARRSALRVGVLLSVVAVAWIDLHAYVRSYGNVHVLLSAFALVGAGSTVALCSPARKTILTGLALGLTLGLTAAVATPLSHSAKSAVLQMGALEKLVIQQVVWPLFDRDGDGAASVLLGADCDDRDADVAPLRLPVRAPSLDCMPRPVPSPPPRAEPIALHPKRDLVLVVVDTWRTDTPRVLPAWTQDFTHFIRYRSCGSRTEQVLGQLIGNEGCPKAFAGSSLADLLIAAGYELAYMGEYGDATGRFPKAAASRTREAALEQARLFFRQRSSDKPLFAVVHLKGGHSPYDGAGNSSRARYDDSIDRTLQVVGSLVPELPAQAVVVIAGDHGEEFGEHDAETHALSLYEEVLRTHVFVRAQGLAVGRNDRELECTGLAEIMATLVSDVPATPPKGASQSFAVVAAPKGVHGGLSETISFASVHADRMKIIWQPRLDVFELYDLEVDPGEKHNLADAQPAILRDLATDLFARVRVCAGGRGFANAN